jgi:hypothetical protein
VNETRNAAIFNRFGYRARSSRLNIGKGLIVTFGQDADKIDCGLRAFKRGGDRLRIAQICLNQINLVRLAE